MFSTLNRLVVAPDKDASLVPGIDTSGAEGLILGLSSDTASAVLVLRIVWSTKDGQYLTTGKPVTFTAGAQPDWATAYLGTPDAIPIFDCLGAHALVKVDSLTPPAAKWVMTSGLR